ncbi:hypothetical protein GCM10027347_59990 [Larkinella harenae]
MGSKSQRNRKFQRSVVQLHHATDRHREELVAQILHALILNEQEEKLLRKDKSPDKGHTNERKSPGNGIDKLT